MKKKRFIILTTTLLGLAAVGFTVVSAQNGDVFEHNAEATGTNCAHTSVNHYNGIEPTIYKSGMSEYWVCCACHKSFKDSGLTEEFENTSGAPTDPTDGRYLAPLGEATEKAFIGDSFYNAGVSVSAEAAPAGYAFTTVYEIANINIRNIFDNFAVVDGFSRISFGLKTASKWFSIRGDWAWSGNSWKIFELVKNNDGKWNIYGATAGNALALKHSNIDNRILSANSTASADSILALTSESDTCYVTNFRVMYDGGFSTIESAHVSASASISSEPAPTGYSFTKVYELTSSNINQIINSSANVDGISMVSFAMKAGVYYASHGWGAGGWSYSGSWKVFELVKTGSDTWNIYTENTVVGYNNGLELKGSGSGHTLSAILQFTSDPSTYYITNLRVLREGKAKIAETAVSGSESVTNMSPTFLQFSQVSKKSLPENQGQPFITAPSKLDGVTEVEFAFLTKNRSFCNNTWATALAKDTWYLAKFTINSASDVSCSIYDASGTVKFSYANKGSFAAALPYYNYSGEQLMEFYSTEIVATLA